MANHNPKNQFKAGEPQTHKRLPAEYKALRKMTHEKLAELCMFVLTKNMADLEDMARDTSITILQGFVVQIAIRILREGDIVAFNILMDRIAGKVKEVTVHEGLPDISPRIVVLPANGFEAKLKQLRGGKHEGKD